MGSRKPCLYKLFPSNNSIMVEQKTKVTGIWSLATCNRKKANFCRS